MILLGSIFCKKFIFIIFPSYFFQNKKYFNNIIYFLLLNKINLKKEKQNKKLYFRNSK
ncbi:hypothetical protein M8044_000437 [Columbia Basin potato purple top phytoplasma]|uniref:Uncharacterized protein n=1 Tax=Columbia Basin potato purple top phytoplasma TaxID=307134 RepID=A0ABT5L9E1_9MOLU|nr:hypothetical protein [Columbia Basin potato purple top phytoplasma]